MLGPDVLEIDDPHRLGERAGERLELRLLDEAARGDDGRDLGRLAGGEDVRGAGREVDHRRHAAGRHRGEDRRGGAVRVRQHDAERLALFGERDELAAEHVRADEQPLVGQRSGDRVLDGDPAPAMGRCRLDHGLEHGAIRRGGPEDEVGHDLVERRARRLAAVAALERRIDREPHRLEHRHRHLRPPAAAHLLARQPREERALEALDLHRQDHGVGLVGDEAGAVVDLHQAAGDGEAPLGEDDQRLAALDGVDQRPRRHRLCRIERHGAGDLQERAHPPALGDAVVDGEDRLLVEERERERARRGS